jgi:hypothetical protein
MPEGICPNCGCRHRGLGLKIRRNQLCIKCGYPLDMKNAGVLVYKANGFKLPEPKISTETEHWEEMREKVAVYVKWN